MDQQEINDKGCINGSMRAEGQMLRRRWTEGELMGRREMKDKGCINGPMRD